jgi:hypothetical protein
LVDGESKTRTNGDFRMTQVLIDRATLEQLVVALNNAEDALNNSQALIAGRERFGFAKTCYAANEIALGFVSPAITAGQTALANAEPKKISLTNTATGSLPQRIESIFEAMDKEVAAGRLVRTGPLEWRKL